MRNKLLKLSIFCIFLAVFSTLAFGQSAANDVEHFNVKFRRGTNQTIKRGVATEYGKSYVYRLRARKEQTITVSLKTSAKDLVFSVILPPNSETAADGFGVTQWSGKALQTGMYSIVLVMNNEKAKKVPYRLQIKVE